MPTLFQTDRLEVRPYRLEDAEDVFDLYGDPEAVVFIGNQVEESMETLREAIQRFINRYEERDGLGFWAVVEKASGKVIGSIILRPLPGHPEIEIGWHFARRVWGKGLAFEAARGCLQYGRERYGFRRIVAVIHPENARSLALARRLGMAHEGRIFAFNQDLELFAWEEAGGCPRGPRTPSGKPRQ